MPVTRFNGLRRFLRLPTRRAADIARDVDSEVEFHLSMKAAELRSQGYAGPEAERLARQAFGDVDYARRRLRAEDGAAERTRRNWQWIEELRQDAVFAVRQLGRHRTFATIAISTLALGVGVNTAIFSAVNGILLKPLPFQDSDELVRVVRFSKSGPRRLSASAPDYTDFRSEARTLTSLSAYYASTANITGSGPPERVEAARVTANFFATLRVTPLLGRSFTEADGVEGAPDVVVLSEGAWRRLFGGDRAALGKELRLDGRATEVVGVVRQEQRFPETTEMWLPLRIDPGMLAEDNRGAAFLRLIGRLAPGVTIEQADAEFSTLSAGIATRFPETRAGTVSRIESAAEVLVGDLRTPLYVLLGAVALVMLIACSNVASLLLSRTVARDAEMTVRTALGAGKRRLIRQLLTESVILAGAGLVCGVGLAVVMTKALIAIAPAGIPRLADVQIDGRVLAATGLLGVVTGLLFGLVPAWHAAKSDLQSRLKAAGRGSAGRGGAARLRGALVVGELGLSIVLLIGAGLLIRSFQRLQEVDTGFRTANLTTFSVTLPNQESMDRQRQFLTAAIARLEQVPAIGQVGASLACH
jgi:predicted permease